VFGLGNPQLFLLHLIFIIPALLVGFTLHEFAHAAVAVRLGDPTPRNQGRLSLDPRRHIHPLGALMVLLAGIGFAKPVMVNNRNLKGEWAQLSVSLAGPAANLAIAIVASVALKVVASATALTPGFPSYLAFCSLTGAPLEVLKTGLYYMYTLNLYLMIFNLFPVPPLDGFEIIRTTLRQRNPHLLYRIEMNRDSIMLVFFVIVLAASSILFFIINLVARPIALLLGVPLGFPCG
jgi:Zn-dependent protease